MSEKKRSCSPDCRHPKCTPMTADEYQAACRRTMAKTLAESPREALASLAMGLSGEAGEVSELTKKYLFHARFQDPGEYREKMLEELGDAAWYLFRLADEMKITPAELFEYNQRKLLRRHPPETTETSSEPA